MVYEHTTDHRHLMVTLAHELGWQRGVEVGVGAGMLAGRLLVEANLVELVGVDLGKRPDRRAMQAQLATLYPNFRMIWRRSSEAAKYVRDGWADFVFIDAGHSYEAVKADIKAWQPKVRSGGWFGGHDYHPAFPGVISAVDALFPDRELLAHSVWKVR